MMLGPELVVGAAHASALSKTAKSRTGSRKHAVPAQYADAGSGKSTTAKVFSKPDSQANSEHANFVASTVHSLVEVAPAAAAFVFWGQLVQAPNVPAPRQSQYETQLSVRVRVSNQAKFR